jgi:lipid-A-disaccharide synthase
VWAWKRARAEVLGRYAAHIATVFPFEVELFRRFKAPVSFVGHPLVEAMQQKKKGVGMSAQREAGYHENPLHIALIPGSRHQEVKAMLPPMVEAFAILRSRYPGITGSISHCRGLPDELFARFRSEPGLEIVLGPLTDLLHKSSLAFVTSGTATLETALMGIPMIIGYRTSRLTFMLLKRFVKMPYIGLPNIVAGEKLVTELIQDHVTGQEMAAAMEALLSNPSHLKSTVSKLSNLRTKLGEKLPSVEVTDILLGIIGKSH